MDIRGLIEKAKVKKRVADLGCCMHSHWDVRAGCDSAPSLTAV